MNDYNILDRTKEFVENLGKKGFYIELDAEYSLHILVLAIQSLFY